MPGKLPNPLSKLPWNVAKRKKREERRLKQEAALLYRELGVAEDATFEEIQEATSLLLARYEGDLKKKVKVEICKDKIMQIRLNQRLEGLVKETSDAAASNYLDEEVEELANKPSSWELPRWAQGIIVKPDNVWRDQCVFWFGGIAALGVLIPTKADSFVTIIFFLASALMGQRGKPKPEPGMASNPFRGSVGWHSLFAILIAAWGIAFYGFIISLIMKALPFLEGSTFSSPFRNILMNLFMGLTVAYVKPYKGS